MPELPFIPIQKCRSNLQCYHPCLQLSQGEKPIAILNQEWFFRILKGEKKLKSYSLMDFKPRIRITRSPGRDFQLTWRGTEIPFFHHTNYLLLSLKDQKDPWKGNTFMTKQNRLFCCKNSSSLWTTALGQPKVYLSWPVTPHVIKLSGRITTFLI